MSNDLKIKGTVSKILDEQSGVSKANKEWKKRDFVITTEGDYPKDVCFTVFGDKVSLIDSIAISDVVDVSFNIESREWEGRYFSNVNAWKIELISPANRDTHTESKGDLPPEFENNPPADDGDLPF